MKSKTLFLLAIICAFSVANIYYNQSMLLLFSQTFNVSAERVGWVAMAVQLAYASGLVLFVPLGDRLNRRNLIANLLLVNSISSVLAATSVNLNMLIVANIFIGITAVGAQIVIPAVSLIVPSEQRGKAVGIVMSGLLSGILFARTISGFVGEYAGWRKMYFLAAIIDLLLILLIAVVLPATKCLTKSSYKELLYSLVQLFLGESRLRLSCFCGALMFGSFSSLWGALAYLLALPPYQFHSDIVGLFGLVGIVGIIASPLIGKLADRFGASQVVLMGAIFLLCAFCLIGFNAKLLPILLLGVVFLDLGGRAGLVGNQLRALSLSESARSRLNTVFMSCYFLGGAVGTKIGSTLAVKYGWLGIAILGLVSSILVILLNVKNFTSLNRKTL